MADYIPTKIDGYNSWRVIGRLAKTPTKRFLNDPKDAIAADVEVILATWNEAPLKAVALKALADEIPTIYRKGDVVAMCGEFGSDGSLVIRDISIIERKGLHPNPEPQYQDLLRLYLPEYVDRRFGMQEMAEDEGGDER